jgi:hypothetical protein
MWDTDDKGKDGAPKPARGFMVGMDNRPVRYPMTDDTFEQFRQRLLDSPDVEVVSVSRVGDAVRIVERGTGHASKPLVALLGALVNEFSIGNGIVIEPSDR